MRCLDVYIASIGQVISLIFIFIFCTRLNHTIAMHRAYLPGSGIATLDGLAASAPLAIPSAIMLTKKITSVDCCRVVLRVVVDGCGWTLVPFDDGISGLTTLAGLSPFQGVGRREIS